MMADVTDIEQFQGEVVSYMSIIRNKYCQIYVLLIMITLLYLYSIPL